MLNIIWLSYLLAFEKNESNSKIIEFGINSNSKKTVNKSRKLLKLRKTFKSKKLSKSGKLPRFDTKKSGPSFLTPNTKTNFNRL